MEEKRIKYLIGKYLDKSLSHEENEELNEFMRQLPPVDIKKNLEKTLALIHAQKQKRGFWRRLWDRISN